jgi:predicted ATP-binding protein involved in virulence
VENSVRIDSVYLKNFKGFEDREFTFTPKFNLLIGVNGTGKTSVLDALAVAAGSWFLGLRGYDTRHISSTEVRLAAHAFEGELSFEPQFPVIIRATGQIGETHLTWERTLTSSRGRTTTQGASEVKKIAASFDHHVQQGAGLELPLISYYGTGRLWLEPRQAKQEAQVKNPEKLAAKTQLSRLAAYRTSVDPRLSVRDLMRWVARQSWISYQQGRESPVFQAVKTALISCVEGAENLYFDPRRGEVVVVMAGQGAQPFVNLSDGQRSMLALVGDIAQKAAKLNPQFGEKVLEETSGVVLIDELDLHLHPRWQRHIIEDLRSTFPQIQFICTTHSPFLIQSLRSGEELVMLDGQPAAQLGNLPLEEIARGIMGVTKPDVSQRYETMRQAAKNYLEILERAEKEPTEKLAAFKQRLSDTIAPFADNPAFQAFLEMKRAAKIGE